MKRNADSNYNYKGQRQRHLFLFTFFWYDIGIMRKSGRGKMSKLTNSIISTILFFSISPIFIGNKSLKRGSSLKS